MVTADGIEPYLHRLKTCSATYARRISLASHLGIEPSLEGLESSLVPEHEILFGTSGRIRTDISQLKRLVSAQLSYGSIVWRKALESNQTPEGAVRLAGGSSSTARSSSMFGSSTRHRTVISLLKRQDSSQLSYRAIVWYPR